jgi:hypothetical protein
MTIILATTSACSSGGKKGKTRIKEINHPVGIEDCLLFLFHQTNKGIDMSHIQNDQGQRTPWNKGKLVGQKPPLKLKAIRTIRIRLQLAGNIRNALFNLAIDSKLRSCDLVKIRVKDLANGTTISSRAIVMQPKNIIDTHRNIFVRPTFFKST